MVTCREYDQRKPGKLDPNNKLISSLRKFYISYIGYQQLVAAKSDKGVLKPKKDTRKCCK